MRESNDTSIVRPEAHGRRRVSWFGVASVLASVVGCLIPISMVFVAGAWIGAMGHAEDVDPGFLFVVLVGLGVSCGVGLALFGILFGLIGLMQSNRGRVFPFLGLALNGLVVAAAAGLILPLAI